MEPAVVEGGGGTCFTTDEQVTRTAHHETPATERDVSGQAERITTATPLEFGGPEIAGTPRPPTMSVSQQTCVSVSDTLKRFVVLDVGARSFCEYVGDPQSDFCDLVLEELVSLCTKVLSTHESPVLCLVPPTVGSLLPRTRVVTSASSLPRETSGHFKQCERTLPLLQDPICRQDPFATASIVREASLAPHAPMTLRSHRPGAESCPFGKRDPIPMQKLLVTSPPDTLLCDVKRECESLTSKVLTLDPISPRPRSNGYEEGRSAHGRVSKRSRPLHATGGTKCWLPDLARGGFTSLPALTILSK